MQLFEEHILPWDCYIPFINLLVEAVKKQPYEEVNTLSLLEQVMTADRTAIGRALVKLYLHQGMIVKLLDALTMSEVVNTGRDWSHNKISQPIHHSDTYFIVHRDPKYIVSWKFFGNKSS